VFRALPERHDVDDDEHHGDGAAAADALDSAAVEELGEVLRVRERRSRGLCLMDRLILDIVTHIFCGESADSLKQAFRQAVERLLRFNSTRVIFG
jgi:hypothetical protein